MSSGRPGVVVRSARSPESAHASSDQNAHASLGHSVTRPKALSMRHRRGSMPPLSHRPPAAKSGRTLHVAP